MPKEHLIEVILSAYSASAETKEYFEFFLNPDVKALTERIKEAIIKELRRTKYGNRSKARISVIRKNIKKYSTFEPGIIYVLSLYQFAICEAIDRERVLYFPPTLYNGISKLVTEMLKYADRQGEFSIGVRLFGEIKDNKKASPYFMKLLNEEYANYMNSNVFDGIKK